MSDFWLITKQSPTNIPPQPLPSGQSYYFGDQSNDFQINPVGDLFTVTGSQKLVQDIQKILLTVQGTNTFLPIYGTTLQTMIGQKITDQNVLATIRTQVINALNVLNFIRQGADPSEIPDTLNYLAITQPNPATIKINLEVTSVAGTTVQTSVIIAPNP